MYPYTLILIPLKKYIKKNYFISHVQQYIFPIQVRDTIRFYISVEFSSTGGIQVVFTGPTGSALFQDKAIKV
jgi:hypothetical protein